VLLLIGTTLLLFIGLIDDLVVLKPYQKFSGQFIAAFCLVRSGFYLKESFFLNNFWSVPLSLFWILSIVNAFNLVDIMDGLASTIAVSATSSFLLIACLNGQWQVALMLTSFLGSVCAFLWYNKPPAHIYLGDAGSLFIGGILATAPFLLKWSNQNVYGFIIPAIILAIPLLEVTSLVVVRTYKRIPFYKASPDHFALYLRNNGWSKNLILIYISVLSLSLFWWSYLILYNQMSFIQFVILSLLFLFIWLFFLCFNFIVRTFKLF
jgi:UDP-GlcNAc:undecaprenyl-phosphate GlcNAc-1-phosphate transferase